MRDLILKFIFQEMRLSRDVFIIHVCTVNTGGSPIWKAITLDINNVF